MACSTDSRVNHYDCSTGFSSSEQREVSLRIKEDVYAVWRLIKKPLCGGKIIMRQNRIQVANGGFEITIKAAVLCGRMTFMDMAVL